MNPIQSLFQELTIPRNVVITMHQKPDADAMGSSLGLKLFLQKLGHTIHVISPTSWAGFLNWMPGCADVIDYERFTGKADQIILSADWIFCLDFNRLNRTKKMAEVLSKAPAIKVLIDHHQEPQTEAFAFGVSDTSKSSTAEMVYDFIQMTGRADILDLDIAQCLYAGVMTDTGSFRFPSTSASVHQMVSNLIKMGLQHSVIHEQLFDQHSENRIRFIGHVLSQRLRFFYEYNTALIAITQQDLIQYDIKTGDTEGLVNYPLSIQGIKLAAIIIDRGEERKCSFRSKGSFDVNTFAKTYFNGGGHFHAAGGHSSDKLEQVVSAFIKAVQENEPMLA
jgi:phosphoesterase RecJ-like protein